ncbi:unnamed protein product [Rhizoctonia solani]|uniref:Peroxisomal membrane protein PEX13 n=1 Tax=Rhizoctonia solani TaxID=456999 RepID=A0A8H2XZS7_9AGAM|nr:unnamed protein product [Rhizoctonia solani]
MGSPPKPWERAGATVLDPAPSVPSLSASESTAPSIPSRPESIASTTQPLTSLSPFSSTTPYGSSYSPYNRFGSYSSYGGYGGGMYGGGYGGGYGMGMGMGMGGYGMNGMYGQPNPGMPVDSVAASTQQAFSLLGNVVGAFTSFAQMLDSSFMATQSSIFAILGVAEQLGQLRNLLGQVVGVFGLVGWLRGWWRGERSGSNMTRDFKKFLRGEGDGSPRPSKKPFILILLAVFGLPYVMHKLVRALSTRLPASPQSTAPIDMSQVQFATVLFDFEAKDPVELGLKKGDLVAILGRTENGDWFRGRTREGKMGWFPGNHVQILKKKVEDEKPLKTV